MHPRGVVKLVLATLQTSAGACHRSCGGLQHCRGGGQLPRGRRRDIFMVCVQTCAQLHLSCAWQRCPDAAAFGVRF